MLPLLRAHRQRAQTRDADGLQPELIRGSRTRTVPKGIVVLFAFLLAVAVGGCGSSQDSNNAIASPSKPDLADLSDRMVIAESEFPPVPDGKFMFRSVQTVDIGGDADNDKCDLDGWPREGDQAAGASVISEGALLYAITIYHFQTKPDLLAWASDCLPRTDEEGAVISRIDLPGLPPGTLSVEAFYNDAPLGYQAIGYVRGLQVSAYVSAVHGGSDGMPAGAKSDLVKIFTTQAERLESY